ISADKAARTQTGSAVGSPALRATFWAAKATGFPVAFRFRTIHGPLTKRNPIATHAAAPSRVEPEKRNAAYPTATSTRAPPEYAAKKGSRPAAPKQPSHRKGDRLVSTADSTRCQIEKARSASSISTGVPSTDTVSCQIETDSSTASAARPPTRGSK